MDQAHDRGGEECPRRRCDGNGAKPPRSRQPQYQGALSFEAADANERALRLHTMEDAAQAQPMSPFQAFLEMTVVRKPPPKTKVVAKPAEQSFERGIQQRE